MRTNQILVILFAIASTALHSCRMADLRTSAISDDTPAREEKAIRLLDKVIANYNLQKLAEAKTYSIQATDDWKGIMAMMNPLPKDNELMELRYRPNSFDGQFNYMETKDKTICGIQSFQYYQIEEDGKVAYEQDEGAVFALSAIQYFLELPLRLKSAPIVKYAGTKEFESKTYDLVFATWQQVEPHKEHDQYLLYISQESGYLAFANYTVRGMYLPMPQNMYGSIRFANLQTSEDGIVYPSTIFVQINKLKQEKRVAHTITIDDLKLNSFELASLYPNDTIEYLGDSK